MSKKEKQDQDNVYEDQSIQSSRITLIFITKGASCITCIKRLAWFCWTFSFCCYIPFRRQLVRNAAKGYNVSFPLPPDGSYVIWRCFCTHRWSGPSPPIWICTRSSGRPPGGGNDAASSRSGTWPSSGSSPPSSAWHAGRPGRLRGIIDIVRTKTTTIDLNSGGNTSSETSQKIEPVSNILRTPSMNWNQEEALEVTVALWSPNFDQSWIQPTIIVL